MSACALDDRLLLLARTRAHGPGRDRSVSAFSRTGEHAASWLTLGTVGAIAAGPFTAARAYRGLLPASGLHTLAVASALSRPYLGVHYPSDVLAGALLGNRLGAAACR